MIKLFLILERIFLGDLLNKIPKFLTHAYALFVVLIGWVLFRSDNISQAFDYLSVMFFLSNTDNPSVCTGEILNYLALIIGCLLVFFRLKSFDSSNAKESVTHNCAFAVNSFLMILSVIVLFFGAQNPFIYFNF